MKKVIAITLLVLVVIGLFIFEPFRSSPPTPTIKAGFTKIPTTEGSYCWHGFLSFTCVDKIFTSALDMANNYKPVIVSPNEDITIKFKYSPLEPIRVTQLETGRDGAIIEVKNNTMKAPREKGFYYYGVISRWEKGSGNHAFSIEVK